MTEEFNLSEKIDAYAWHTNQDQATIKIAHVKEFIKILKELVKDYAPSDPREYMISAKFIREKIDKLAGDKLI